MTKGLRLYGKVTSNNGVENINNALSEARDMAIVNQIDWIVRYQQRKFSERKAIASKWEFEGKMLTNYCIEADSRFGAIANTRKVEFTTTRERPVYKALVSSGGLAGDTTTCIEVCVDIERKVATCTCKFYDEMGMQCYHVKAVLLKLESEGASTKAWTDPFYHLDNYKKCYAAPIPTMAIGGKLKANDKFIPPDHRRPAGRPNKKRKERSHLRTTNVRRTCKACGEEGHFANTCTQPSTQYRYTSHKAKALEWCKRNECITIED